MLRSRCSNPLVLLKLPVTAGATLACGIKLSARAQAGDLPGRGVETSGGWAGLASAWADSAARQVPGEVLHTFVVLAFALLIYYVASRLIRRLDRDTHLDHSLVVTLKIVLRWLFVLLTSAAIMQVWHVLDQFWAAITALLTLVAIGFVAVWSVLSNVLCSLILLAARPFRIGQRISLPPDEMLEGVVLEVTLLHTVLKTDSGDLLKIPNNTFFQRTLQIRPAEYIPPAVPKPPERDIAGER